MYIKIINFYNTIKQDIENEREAKNWEKISTSTLYLT